MVHSQWIDYRRQLDRITSAVDEFGTAGLTTVDTAASRARVRPYGNGYDGFVFDRKDRVIRARSGSDPDALVGPADGRLRDEVFDIALFLVDSEPSR